MGLEFVIGTACILAGATVVFAWMAFMVASPKLGGLVLGGAVAFAVVALGAAVIDDNDAKAESGVIPTPTPTATPVASYFASNLAAFRGPRLVKAHLKKSLCLVRYFDRARARSHGGDPNANWWTTCKANHGLRTIAAVRRALALPHEWGARDGRVFARVPAGARITYLRGIAARQCEPHRGQCYRGGGTQLLFVPDDFQRTWFTRRECARGPKNETAPAKFVTCTG